MKNDKSWDQADEFVRRSKEGDVQARERVWSPLQTFVRYIVNSQIRNCKHDLADIEDLVNAGNKGLLDAYEKFDVSETTKFTTYAYWFIRKAIDVEKWVIRGLDEDLARYASGVYKAKHAREKSGKSGSDISEIAKKAGVSYEKTDRIITFLNINFVQIEKEDSDGSQFEWISGNDDEAETSDDSDLEERLWEFREEEIGYIIPRIAQYLTGKWKKEDPNRFKIFNEAMQNPDICYKRRFVFANGARGMIDISTLENLNQSSEDSGIYFRRGIWKNKTL